MPDSVIYSFSQSVGISKGKYFVPAVTVLGAGDRAEPIADVVPVPLELIVWLGRRHIKQSVSQTVHSHCDKLRACGGRRGPTLPAAVREGFSRKWHFCQAKTGRRGHRDRNSEEERPHRKLVFASVVPS